MVITMTCQDRYRELWLDESEHLTIVIGRNVNLAQIKFEFN